MRDERGRVPIEPNIQHQQAWRLDDDEGDGPERRSNVRLLCDRQELGW
ncbi:MAG: hypothetical protein GY872_12815 [Roseibacillus sp.]|nr:hypothetical protein [Roseibacillus sp.]